MPTFGFQREVRRLPTLAVEAAAAAAASKLLLLPLPLPRPEAAPFLLVPTLLLSLLVCGLGRSRSTLVRKTLPQLLLLLLLLLLTFLVFLVVLFASAPAVCARCCR